MTISQCRYLWGNCLLDHKAHLVAGDMAISLLASDGRECILQSMEPPAWGQLTGSLLLE